MAEKRNTVVGIDLGSNRLRSFAAAMEGNSLRYLGSASIASAGWSKGRLSDPNALQSAIRELVAETEAEAGVAIESAVLGIGGPTVRSFNLRGIHELGSRREIDQFEVSRAIEKARRLQLLDDQMILQLFPQYFLVDEDAEYRDPRGIPGSILEAYVHVITTSASDHANLIGLCNQAHIEIEATVFEPIATALASILPEDREGGVALIDIGHHNTEVIAYWQENLVHSFALPISAEHFTRDVARGLQVSPPDAERMKIEYGCALVGLTADNSLIELPPAHGQERRERERRFLNYVLQERGRELMEMVRRELALAGMDGHLGTGVLIAGGGALLSGICDLAEQVLNCRARLALPIGVRDLPDAINQASWSTAVGLSMYAARLRVHENSRREHEGWIGRIFR
ncbi:MAG: cell division protein FtsA [Bryobacterales bacterium]|nr:cell division protein FtsA [Bryobacterales bacterium]